MPWAWRPSSRVQHPMGRRTRRDGRSQRVALPVRGRRPDRRARRCRLARSHDRAQLRRQHGHPEHAAKLTDRVVGSGGLPFLVWLDGGQDHVGDRREEQRHPEARDRERPDEINVRGGRRRNQGDLDTSSNDVPHPPATTKGGLVPRIGRTPPIRQMRGRVLPKGCCKRSARQQ